MALRNLFVFALLCLGMSAQTPVLPASANQPVKTYTLSPEKLKKLSITPMRVTFRISREPPMEWRCY